ncbi:MAG: (d)CMP kinase [Candidatus Methylomirabilia bacterium]
MNKLVVAVDGPGAAGKSTVSKALAARLGYLYIDTGALYRAVAWLADREGLADAAPEIIGARVGKADIRLEGDPRLPRVLVDGRDVSGEIRSERISQLSSKLSALAEVRGALLELQRRIGAGGGVVMDGRDIGTVIFPAAEAKFFVSASPEVRARRRHAELRAKGADADPELVRAELEERDRRDAGRAHAPLKAAADAVLIDTTDLTPEAVVERMLAIINNKPDTG